jgi:hypothetical protein
MIVKKGQYSKIEDEKEPDPIEEIPTGGEETDDLGDKEYRGPENGPPEIIKAKKFTTDKPSKILKKPMKKKDWGDLSSKSLLRNQSTLSDAAKKIIKGLKTTQPAVNWKKELKKFFDQSFKSVDWVLPNKRFLAGGDILYGRKNRGEDTFKTIVAAVDTSGSISKKQIKIFLNEIMYLAKTFNADKTIIIYCSDDIDNVDIVKKGNSPDFTKIKSTGGNRLGFAPPFKWVEDNKIKPSIFIYLTDTGGEMPDANDYGIKKYMKKVFWFICSTKLYNKPPFGTTFMAPPNAIDNSWGDLFLT